MPETKCSLCQGPLELYYKSKPLCRNCFKEVCPFCSEQSDFLSLKKGCPGHTITSSTRNRFMEDNTFVKGGGFDLESE
jgi:hypothetical protein